MKDPKQAISSESGTGIISSIAGILVALLILQAIVYLARIADTRIRSLAVAQDTARLFAGIDYQNGYLSRATILDTAKADLGSLAKQCALNETTKAPMNVTVAIQCSVPLIFSLGNIVSSSISSRATITN
ncbi:MULTISPECIES: hypothetical protein [Acidithrix]|uniref:Uncharacterized protein n=1 Tax=Acidithrix ferrooxidans TaxID=1280514 RepID=A0A0D8HFD0_9ACTN|nr:MULTISPECIES: hypothetical protein [Acidithrix]KJF16492.1 hypothetical protein AXFE_26570 [Acidithrix ferrooxidans]CAG4928940.1 unnamed protein product [Acidithrix sp. C25]